MAAAAMMVVFTAFAAGDEKNGHAYFTKAELPDMTKCQHRPSSNRPVSWPTSRSTFGEN